MKKMFFATAFALAMLYSCSIECEDSDPPGANEGVEVVVNFDKAGGRFDCRTFFDNTVEAEPWEKEIRRADVYVYDEQGKILMYKTFSPADLTSLSTKLVLPESAAGTECTFYAVANSPSSGSFSMENELLNSNYQYVAYYNSMSVYDFYAGTQSTSALPMSDSKKVIIQPKGTPTDVSLVMRRAVAKIALKVNVDVNAFAAKYHGGMLRVYDVEVINAASTVFVVENPQIPALPMDYCFKQFTMAYSNGEHHNLFYLGENPPLDADSKVILRIKAIFDQDGNYLMTDDQIPFEWDLRIEGSGNGEIKRNGYYRISARIDGIDALDNIQSFITAGEWESPVSPEAQNLH